MEGCKLIKVKKITEDDGSLLVMEEGHDIPFPIKRIFCIMNVAEGKSRGDHATKKTKLILFPISGSCEVEVDNGKEKELFLMNDATQGLYISEMIWRSMRNFTNDCVMMAVCDRCFEVGNETYDDYDEFLAELKKVGI